MKAGFYFAVAAAALCAAGAAALYCRRRKKNAEPVPEIDTVQARFSSEWTTVLTSDARVFNGLFNGLRRVQNGTAKKPEKVLREWCSRTHYQFENQTVDSLCQAHILPLIEAADREGVTKWANLLLEAAAAAGIAKEEATTMVLTEQNTDAYVEWDGNDLYPEDEITVITPAWYQYGKLLEQGQCRKKETA